MRVNFRRPLQIISIAAALASATLVGGRVGSAQNALAPSASEARERFQVTFDVVTGSEDVAPGSNDQITILFCNTSSDAMKAPPRPIFNDDIVEEFSFSGREARPGTTFTFKRFVSSNALLSARFIRIVNHGVDGWGGSALSMTFNGQRVFDRVPLTPRKGSSTRGGIQKYNPVQWYERVYWEGELQRLRLGRASAF